MQVSDLVTLHFHKNSAGKFHCPLTFKIFNENSRIVAIKTSGNVYSAEAIEQFNFKSGNWKDLLTDEAFTKEDVITIQDAGSSRQTVSKQDLEVSQTKELSHKRSINTISEGIAKKKTKIEDEIPRTNVTSGACAASFTSTVMRPVTDNMELPMTDGQLREKLYSKARKLKSKGKAIVQLHTSKGVLVFLLHCEKAPKTCYNFLLLCQSGYYNNTKFHRLIPGFMIQGGDPTATGRGGESIWKGKFDDEFHDELKHDSRGIVSMANSGPNSNASQL